MKKVTVCEEYVRMCPSDELAREILHAILIKRGRLALTTDRGQCARKRYLAILKGRPKRGMIKELLMNIYKSGAISECEAISASEHDKSLFANVALQTRKRQIACESKEDYVFEGGAEKYLTLFERLQVRGTPEWWDTMLLDEDQEEKPMDIRVLFISADPSNVLNIQEEMRTIKERIMKGVERDRIKMEICPAARIDDMTQKVLEFEPNVLHFSGHGSPVGAICFQGNDGKIKETSADAIAKFIEAARVEIKVVLLNACYSAVQAQRIAEIVPLCIGATDSIRDDVAITYSSGLYQALAAGRNYLDAHKLGVAQVGLQHGKVDVLPTVVGNKA